MRWVRSNASFAEMSAVAHRHNGKVSCIASKSDDSMHASEPATALENLHMRIKASFDPRHILNRGVLPFEKKMSSMPVVEPLATSIAT